MMKAKRDIIILALFLVTSVFCGCRQEDEPERYARVVLQVMSDKPVRVSGCCMKDTIVTRSEINDIAFEKEFLMSEYGYYFKAECDDEETFLYCDIYIDDKLTLHVDGNGSIHTGWFF